MALPEIVILIQIFMVSADVLFWRVGESQSVELSCPMPEQSTLSGLYLYHSSTHSQTTLLSLHRDGTPRINTERRGRLWLTGGLGSAQVNVTLLNLEQDDTGLYVWEVTDKNNSERSISDHKLFLLVEATEKLCPCSSFYPPLLFMMCAASLLFMVIIFCLGLDHCVKFKDRQPSAPIYEEMTRKQQTTGVAQNIPETPSHLEEASFPVYANPNLRQPQDNYYACPRRLRDSGWTYTECDKGNSRKQQMTDTTM